ncbi:hypothetical protein [Stappia indica]|uniref:hypothetical protein n=1 Tax=Stappia indica TaxID=538381 RepID=UPI001CD4AC79|nr:hypothetical protein [Stappia indica]MCA1300576.1 hypothetical protein [Stappia indica]
MSIQMHGLWAATLYEALAEMCAMAADCRSRKPLVHVWASPSVEYDETEWTEFWTRFEEEFSLEGQPYFEAEHLKWGKGGRTSRHRHRVYLRVDLDGRAIPMRHTVPRLEKLSRISEFLHGEAFTSGSYNASVLKYLRREGLDDIANAMDRQGLGHHRASALCSAAERAIAERSSDVAPDEAKRLIFDLLTSSGGVRDIAAVFEATGLRLALGKKAIVAVTPKGNRIPVLRAFNQVARRRGGERLKKADLDTLLKDAELPDAETLGPQKHLRSDFIQHVGAERRGRREASPERMTPSYEDAPYLEEKVPKDTLPDFDPIDVSRLTAAQEKALREWNEYLFAAPELKAAQDEIEASSVNETPQSKLRISCSGDLAKSGSLARQAWKTHFNAGLAGLPDVVAEKITWVDQGNPDCYRIGLKETGAIITVEPTLISTSAAAQETPEIMVQIAVSMGWAEVEVHSDDQAWSEAVTRAAIRAGLAIANPELRPIAEDETERMAIKAFVREWLAARSRFLESRNADAIPNWAQTVKNLLARPKTVTVMSPELYEMLLRDMGSYEDFEHTARIDFADDEISEPALIKGP